MNNAAKRIDEAAGNHGETGDFSNISFDQTFKGLSSNREGLSRAEAESNWEKWSGW
ncbi:MAG: hypothetical protein ACLQU2_24505 [Candidatus Binataceae bacterium]